MEPPVNELIINGAIGNVIVYIKTIYSTLKDTHYYCDIETAIKWIIGLLVTISQAISTYKNIMGCLKYKKTQRRLIWMSKSLTESAKKDNKE
jgi:hypothetical protein